MKIAILKERRPHEARVAASADSVKKFAAMGIEVVVETGAGDGASIPDGVWQTAGASIAKDAAAALKGVDIVLKVARPMLAEEGLDEVALFSKGQTLICHMAALTQPRLVQALAAQGVTAFAMELVPRITRAQSMDILSSQANIAGYKAVLDALEHYGRGMPMMMTAAGTVPPAKVFIMGVGVAGLQAIATAKRMGAVVTATDVRPATKEQVESLGGKFIAVENDEFQQAQTAGGYAKEMSDDYKRQQAELVAKHIKEQDIVITTALIPGRPAPVLVSEDMVKTMKPGAVIVDLAVEAGGNCPLSEFGAVVKKHGVTLVGHANVPARVPETTSSLFARNLLNFLTPMLDKETKALKIDTADEVVKGTLVVQDGEVVNDRVRDAIAAAGPAAAPSVAAEPKPQKAPAARKSPAKKAAPPAADEPKE